MQMKHVGLGNRIPGYNNEKLSTWLFTSFPFPEAKRCTLVQSSLRSDELGQNNRDVCSESS